MERYRERERGNIRYSDVDISLSEMHVICRHDQMRSEDGQREKSEGREGVMGEKKNIPSLVRY